ncbi:glycoside hydrolase family 27 protein [Plebeiibacterium sediminum]
MKKNLLLITLLLLGFITKAQKFDDLAQTPPMGWNSWNKFACNVSDEMLRDIADAMVSSGMKDAGYEYIVVDDCWHGERDSLGFIHENKEHFPSGIKATIDYIHSKGLKFGIYSCAGAETCAGKPGSRGHEFQDALTYAQWGVDYLKYDWCNTENINAIGAYTTMRDALYAAKRPVVFSLCEWGDNKPWEWGAEVGHLWRTTGDIYDCFDCEEDHGTWSSWGVMKILDMQDGLREFAGPGHWNDPDMMEVGNGGMTTNEDRAHFSMWCMLASPLIAGNDLTNMSEETLTILTNKEAIAVNQDSLGIQGFKFADKDSLETWFKPLSEGNWAVCFLNRSAEAKDIEFDWKTKVYDEFAKRDLDAAETSYEILDIWTNQKMGKTKKVLKTEVPSHDVVMLKLSKK